jgi:hypothetical protein
MDRKKQKEMKTFLPGRFSQKQGRRGSDLLSGKSTLCGQGLYGGDTDSLSACIHRQMIDELDHPVLEKVNTQVFRLAFRYAEDQKTAENW